jgi:SAM-dependent methyltransferase
MTKMVQEGLVYDADIEKSGLSAERRLTLERVGRDKSVLEVGAHTGYFSERLRLRGCRVTAVEMDPIAAQRAAEKADRVIVGDIEDDKVRAQLVEPFDVILYMHTLEHLVDPWKVLRESRSILRDGGSIITLIPNVAAWRIRKDLFFKGAFEYEDVGTLDRTHLRFFTLDSARALLEDTGYRIVFWKATDVCVPIERRLRLTPVIGALNRAWSDWMVRRFPNLCTEIVLFQAVPVDAPR